MNDLTPETVALLRDIQGLGLPPLHECTPAEARELRKSAAALGEVEVEEVADVLDLNIDGPDRPLPVRVYTPARPADASQTTHVGTLVYFHGGGWVLGSLDTHDALCRGLANSSGLEVVAVDYRLAPENPHPAALDDAWTATEWAAARARSSGGSLVVGGDSAGGHLATCVSARARQSGPEIAAQVLVYPVTDLSSFETASYGRYAEGYWLTTAAMEWFRNHYLSAGTDRMHPDVSPLYRSDLRGMPPAILVAAGCDVLLDEGARYAERLIEDGGEVTVLSYPGVIHGFMALPAAIPEGRQAINDVGTLLRLRLGRRLDGGP